MKSLGRLSHEYRVFELQDGKYTEVEPITMRATLFGVVFDAKDARLVRVEKPTGKDRLERQVAKLRAISAMQKGVDGFFPLGSGNGAKQGRFWFANRDVLQQAASWFTSAEDAAAYGAVLFSECNHGLFQLIDDAKVMEEPDGSDGMGYVDMDTLAEMGLPACQLQIRAIWGKTMAKGTLLPVKGLKKREGVSFMLHPSQLKGRDIQLGGEWYLGIRDVATKRDFRSGWTVTQWFSDEVQEKLWEKYGREKLKDAARAFTSNEEALRFIGAVKQPPEGDRTLLEKYLRAGLPLRHPWLKKKMCEHVRSAWVDGAMGLGLVMKGGMAYFTAELGDDEVSCPWLPDGAEVVLTRYPVRDAWSFRVVTNRLLPGTPQGSIGTNGRLGLDDDQDGDYLVVIEEPLIIEEVRRLQGAFPVRSPRPAKKRKASPLMGLARVMVEAMSGGCVGSPTWLIAGALNSERIEHIPVLSDQVQDAVESLKWHSSVDWKVLREVEKAVELPAWLKLVKDRKEFTCRVTKVEDKGLGRFWNRAVEKYEQVMLELASHPSEFVDYVPAPDGRFLSEVEAVRVKFNRLIAVSDGDMDRICKVIDRLRAWAESKTEDREEWARTVWWAVHMSASAKSTCSMAMHGFVEENEVCFSEGVSGSASPTSADKPVNRSRISLQRLVWRNRGSFPIAYGHRSAKDMTHQFVARRHSTSR